jgi:N-acetylneuraminic acid mutarotase
MRNKLLLVPKRFLILLITLHFTSNIVKSQPIKGSWESITDMPTARWFPGTAVYGGKIYIIGGNLSSTTAPLGVVEVYSPTTDTWETKTPMPIPRSQLSACTLNEKIYVIGGSSGPSTWTPVPDVAIYDPLSDTWATGADMPDPRTELTLIAVQDKIYAIGGIDGSSTGSRSVDIYDPAENTWSKGADMPTARGAMPACEIDGKIYVYGGTNGNASGWNHYSTLEVYDIEANSWSTSTGMPWTRSHLTGCVLNNKIFAIGGSQVNLGMSYATMASYNPNTDSWETEPPMITDREAFTSVVVDGKIYAIGGTQMQNGLVAFSTSEVYDTVPKVFLSKNELRLPAKQGSFIAKLFVPNSGSLSFTYQINEGLYDGALFEINADSLFAAQYFGLNSSREYQFEILAVSENNDSVRTSINLSAVFKINAAFTGPNGFLLESSNKKVMLDVLASKTPGNGFVANSGEIYENMKNAVEPFNNIDLIYSSHAHPCHFDAELVLNAMLNNPNAISVMGIEAENEMEQYFEAYPDLADRIFAPEIPSKSFIDTTLAGIKIRLTNIPHGSKSTLGINLMLDSIQFVHFDDYNNLTEEDYETIGFTQLPTDVAFIGALLLDGEQQIIKEIYQPSDYITVSHIINISSLYNGYLTKAEMLEGLNYQINIPRWPMEMFSYTKYDNRISLSTINSAPKLSRTFADFTVELGATKNVAIFQSTFKDTDPGDTITYTYLINNLPLPEWAIYNTTLQRLELTPPEVKTYTITIIATDNHLSFANTSFKLQVTEPDAIENLGGVSEYKVYPNPAQSVINIESTGEQKGSYSVNLYSILGEKIYSINEYQNKKTEIDISRFSESVLFLVITTKGRNECHKIIKN